MYSYIQGLGRGYKVRALGLTPSSSISIVDSDVARDRVSCKKIDTDDISDC